MEIFIGTNSNSNNGVGGAENINGGNGKGKSHDKMITNLVIMTHFLVMTPFSNDMKGSPPPRAFDLLSDIMIAIILCFSILRPFFAFKSKCQRFTSTKSF